MHSTGQASPSLLRASCHRTVCDVRHGARDVSRAQRWCDGGVPDSARSGPAYRADGAVWAGMVTLWFVWGSTYLAIAYVVEEMPTLLAIGMRYVTAAIILATFVAIRRGPAALKRPAAEIKRAGLEGVLLIGAGNGAVSLSENHVPSGVVAIIVAMMPMWVAVLRSLTGDRPSRLTLFGIAAGLSGVALIVFSGEQALAGGSSGTRTLWSLAVVLGTLGWASGSFFGPRIAARRDALVGTVWQMTIGGSVMATIGFLTGERTSSLAGASSRAWWALAFLVVIGSLVGQTTFTWLLGSGAPLSLVATYTYVNPVVALLLGAWFHHEGFDVKVLVGGAVVLSAVAIVARGEQLKRRA